MDIFNSSTAFWLSVLLVLGFIYVKRQYGYWKRHGISFVQPKFPAGNLCGAKQPEHLSQLLAKFYSARKNDAPILGMYFFLSPVLLINDLKLIRNIFSNDFQYFWSRGSFYNEKHDPLSANLFNLDYDKWRPLRSKLTQTFSSAKMKVMFGIVESVANELVDCLNRDIKIDGDADVHEWLCRFTTDVIGSCTLGIECNSLKDPRSVFRAIGKKVFEQPKLSALQRTLVTSNTNLARFMRIRAHHKDVTDFFLNIIKKTIEYRENNNVLRNDLMSLLIDLKNAEKDSDRLSILEVAAQAFVFFLAGFEASSTTLTYCLYELALNENKHIQEKARHEISKILEKYDGNLTYEAVNEMTYIDQIIYESIRKHPLAATIARLATKDYKVPNSNYTIPKGMQVFIPTYAIYRDPEIYENPDVFEPDRFSPEKVKNRPSHSFIPFGEGPRKCIGLRFGMLQTRVGVVKMLQNFELSTCNRTQIPIKYSPKKLFLEPENGTWLKLTKIEI